MDATDLNLQVRDNLRYLKGLDGVPYIETAIELPEMATPATPAAGRGRAYFKSDGGLWIVNDGGQERRAAGRSGANVFNSANLSIPNAADTVLTFNSETYDDAAFHSTSVNTGRLTAPATDDYWIGFLLRFASNGTGIREVTLRLNGATGIGYATYSSPTASASVTLTLNRPWSMTAGDYVEIVAFQNSGGALDINAAGSYSPHFWMIRQ